jgi:phospholipid/cholesterol/gamma-HCH transport system permease protein
LSGPLRFAGDLSLFGFRAVQEAFRPPFEFAEIAKQIFEAGWKSTPLIIASGFAFGIVLSLQTRSSMVSFGAEAMIPQSGIDRPIP